MDSSLIIAVGSLITVVVGAVVTLKKFKGENRATTITGEVALSDGWEKYAVKLEERLSIAEQKNTLLENKFDELRESFNKVGHEYLELQRQFNDIKAELEGVKAENKRLTEDNTAKIGRITTLEGQVLNLQSQLDSYKHVDVERVDDAKAVLHESVESSLNDLKE